MNSVYVPVSIGELIDKITILEIKQEKLTDSAKLINVTKELSILKNVLDNLNLSNLELFVVELKNLNILLWDIENKKRNKEKEKNFDLEFIKLSRLVYFYNDKRAQIKKQINILTNSDIIEEKSYEEFFNKVDIIK